MSALKNFIYVAKIVPIMMEVISATVQLVILWVMMVTLVMVNHLL